MPVSSRRATPQALEAELPDARSTQRLRVLRAARQLIAERGLGVSMEEIADAAGIARRTLFRHVDRRDVLIADALTSSLDWYESAVIESAAADAPFEEWLEALLLSIHRLHQKAGRGLWQLAAASDDDLPEPVRAVNRRRRARRRQVTKAIAATAWERARGVGPCPPILVEACALTISSFATRSMIDDLGRDARSVAHTSAAMLSALIREQKRSPRADSARSSLPER